MRLFVFISIFTLTVGNRVLHTEKILQAIHSQDLEPLLAVATASPVKTRSNPGINYGNSFQNLVGDPVDQAAYTNVDWAPDKTGAEAVVKALQGTHWPGYREAEHGTITNASAADFIWLYTGSGVYATNVERVSRGAVALTVKSSYGAVADAFDTDPIEATALAVQFTAGLCAALALLPTETPPTLFRGALEPPTMKKKLQGLVKSGATFTFPGLASTAEVKAHAISFMGKGPYRSRNGDNVLYEFKTVQAKNVTHINPGETEWILPPNREFRVLSIDKRKRNSVSDYYHVKLEDA